MSDGLSISLGEEQMRAIVAEAIIAKLDEEARKNLIQQAIEKMLTPEKTGYGYSERKRSPLETAFESAVHQLTFETAREYIATHPEVRERIQEALGEALQKLTQDHTRIRQAVASAVASALEQKLNDD